MRISLRAKLAIFSIALVCIPLLAVMLPSVLIFRDIQKNSALEREAEIAASASKELASFFSEQFKIMSEAEILLLPHASSRKQMPCQQFAVAFAHRKINVKRSVS